MLTSEGAKGDAVVVWIKAVPMAVLAIVDEGPDIRGRGILDEKGEWPTLCC